MNEDRGLETLIKEGASLAVAKLQYVLEEIFLARKSRLKW